jgi:hypothetical protein
MEITKSISPKIKRTGAGGWRKTTIANRGSGWCISNSAMDLLYVLNLTRTEIIAPRNTSTNVVLKKKYR